MGGCTLILRIARTHPVHIDGMQEQRAGRVVLQSGRNLIRSSGCTPTRARVWSQFIAMCIDRLQVEREEQRARVAEKELAERRREADARAAAHASRVKELTVCEGGRGGRTNG